MPLAFPKPKDVKRAPPEAVTILPDGREVCNNATALGRAEYRRRTLEMVERQGDRCCLEAYAPMCPGYLRKDEATFDHEFGRGANGGKRDDRTKVPDPERPGEWIWQNGACHEICNRWKSSRYISYNRGFQP